MLVTIKDTSLIFDDQGGDGDGVHADYSAYRDTSLISLHQGDGDHGGRQGDGDGVHADYHQF